MPCGSAQSCLGDSSLIAESPEQGADLSIPNPSLNEDSTKSVPATETSEEARLLPTIEPIESQQTPMNSGSPTQTHFLNTSVPNTNSSTT